MPEHRYCNRQPAAVNIVFRGIMLAESEPITRPVRILLVGPFSSEIGGATVSFQHLVRCLEERKDVNFQVLGTRGIRSAGWRGLLRFVRLTWDMISRTRDFDVLSVHASITGLPYLGPVVLIAGRMAQRPVVFRLFGGIDHRLFTGINRHLSLQFLKKVDLYLAQTKQLISSATEDGIGNVCWFPTSRPMLPDQMIAPTRPCRRFVFIGHLLIQKGLQYLVEAAQTMPDDVGVDVYGPWYDLPRDIFDSSPNVRYCGVLAPEDVIPTMSRYDCAVLPSFLDAEGYAGMVFEAYSAGKPVIATRWRALPEIVKDEETGLLIEPRDSKSLQLAMMRLIEDQALYARLCNGAYAFGRAFSVEALTDKFIGYCRQTLHRYNGSAAV